jgi:hypothetical protein
VESNHTARAGRQTMATAVVRRERRFAQLPFALLQDLMSCRDAYGVALFVHKCMKIAEAAAVAAVRQQPR